MPQKLDGEFSRPDVARVYGELKRLNVEERGLYELKSPDGEAIVARVFLEAIRYPAEIKLELEDGTVTRMPDLSGFSEAHRVTEDGP